VSARQRRIAALESMMDHLDDRVSPVRLQHMAQLVLRTPRGERLPDGEPSLQHAPVDSISDPLTFLIRQSMEGDPLFADVGKGFGAGHDGAETEES
jgi:hypothetical protein